MPEMNNFCPNLIIELLAEREGDFNLLHCKMWGTSPNFFLISPGVVKKFGRPIFFGGKYFTILVPPNLADEIFGQN